MICRIAGVSALAGQTDAISSRLSVKHALSVVFVNSTKAFRICSGRTPASVRDAKISSAVMPSFGNNSTNFRTAAAGFFFRKSSP